MAESPTKKPRPPHVRATGVPPYTELARRLTEIETLLSRMPQDIVGRTDELMQRYGLAAGNVTYDQLKSTVCEAVQAVLAQVGHRTCEQESAPTESERPNEIFMWGGALYRLTKDYVLTAHGTDTSPNTFRTATQAYMR